MDKKRLHNHLKQLVNFYPKTDHQTAVREALKYCEDVLRKSASFEDVEVHDYKGVYSLTASTQRTKKPKLLLEAHIDVVPACDENLEFHHDKKAKQLHGRGVYDMLFAVASYLTFIEDHSKELSQLDLGLMITGDEEIGGFNGTGYLVEQGYGCEICLIPDAGNGFGDLSVSAKGVYNFDLVAHGKAHHGSRPWEGDGAANKLIHLLHQLLHEFDDSDHDNSTLTVTGLSCGEATNQGPAQATAHLDIRYKDAADFQRIRKLVDKLCADMGAETKHVMLAYNLAIDPANPHIQDFLKLYEQHAGHPITLSKAHGGSDARFFAAQGIPVIMLRPDGTGAHAAHESLSLASLHQFHALLEAYILHAAKRVI